ncbi:hypothetical protein Taro_015688, partial [Colocasia esculenta]|nr:hypothetical protein [Colocasia esculenta]
MNCVELDPYIEEFDSVILQWNPRLTDVQVEKEHEKSFATWLRYQDNEQDEVDPNALEWEVESDEEEEWTDDEDEEDDEDDVELDISSRYGMWRTYWEGVHLCRPRIYADRCPPIALAPLLGDPPGAALATWSTPDCVRLGATLQGAKATSLPLAGIDCTAIVPPMSIQPPTSSSPSTQPSQALPPSLLHAGSDVHAGHSFAQVVMKSIQPPSLPLKVHVPACTDSGEPAVFFSMDEVWISCTPLAFAIIARTPLGRPSFQEIRLHLAQRFSFKQDFIISALYGRHLLLRFQNHEDYLQMDLSGLPANFYNDAMIHSIAGSVGQVLQVHKDSQCLTRTHAAHVYVQLDVLTKLLERVWVGFGSGGIWQPLVFPDPPSFCQSCHRLGHLMSSCKKSSTPPAKDPDVLPEVIVTRKEWRPVSSLPKNNETCHTGKVTISVDALKDNLVDAPFSETGKAALVDVLCEEQEAEDNFTIAEGDFDGDPSHKNPEADVGVCWFASGDLGVALQRNSGEAVLGGWCLAM